MLTYEYHVINRAGEHVATLIMLNGKLQVTNRGDSQVIRALEQVVHSTDLSYWDGKHVVHQVLSDDADERLKVISEYLPKSLGLTVRRVQSRAMAESPVTTIEASSAIASETARTFLVWEPMQVVSFKHSLQLIVSTNALHYRISIWRPRTWRYRAASVIHSITNRFVWWFLIRDEFGWRLGNTDAREIARCDLNAGVLLNARSALYKSDCIQQIEAGKAA